MDNRDELDLENEYTYDPNEILDETPENQDLEFDYELDTGDGQPPQDDELDELLSDDFLASLGIAPMTREAPEAESEEESAPQETEAMQEYIPEPAFDVESDLGAEFTEAFEKDFPSAADDEPAGEDAVSAVPGELDPEEQKQTAKPRTRRKKMSRERMIKEVYLPPVIIALAVILILTFTGTAIARTVRANREQQAALQQSQQEASNALAQEAADLVARANVLAAGYDYDAALALLDTFSGDKSQYPSIMDAINTFSQAKASLKPIDDPNSIPNLSFHCLIADPSRAFTDKTYGSVYNSLYVTIDEFSKILEQMYANGYVLVDFDSFIVETVGPDGKITYSTQPIYLPDGKKPFMLTETLVNYETFSIDGDGDGEPDKDGDGFASKLVLDANGNITCEMVDAQGNTVYGAYDMVPILEAFIAEHPDFCYQGARATLAVSGEDGVFGYRINHSVKNTKGEDYYNQQVEGAKIIVQALRDKGYTIACYTYGNVAYGQLSATRIEADLDAWKKEIKPVLGDVPVMVYAKSSDISAGSANYEGGKYNVLKNAGFRYFISSGSSPYTEVTANYIRQARIQVTGQELQSANNPFAQYFNAKDVLNDQRGK